MTLLGVNVYDAEQRSSGLPLGRNRRSAEG
jgi:hypothetical protein